MALGAWAHVDVGLHESAKIIQCVQGSQQLQRGDSFGLRVFSFDVKRVNSFLMIINGGVTASKALPKFSDSENTTNIVIRNS